MFTLVGAGFLGSIFMEELYKRAFAAEQVLKGTVVDFDEFEERNAANQNVTLEAARSKIMKARWLSDMGRLYGQKIDPLCEKVDADNIEQILKDTALIIDAVDNYPTRKLLWQYGLGHGIPVLHLGISQEGTGSVDWSYETKYDSWPLSPVALGGKELAAPPPTKLPPCDLVGLRGLGLNVALAGAKAFCLYYGVDPEKYFGDLVDPQMMSIWTATNHGHRMEECTWFDEVGNGQEKEVPQTAR